MINQQNKCIYIYVGRQSNFAICVRAGAPHFPVGSQSSETLGFHGGTKQIFCLSLGTLQYDKFIKYNSPLFVRLKYCETLGFHRGTMQIFCLILGTLQSHKFIEYYSPLFVTKREPSHLVAQPQFR